MSSRRVASASWGKGGGGKGLVEAGDGVDERVQSHRSHDGHVVALRPAGGEHQGVKVAVGAPGAVGIGAVGENSQGSVSPGQIGEDARRRQGKPWEFTPID